MLEVTCNKLPRSLDINEITVQYVSTCVETTITSLDSLSWDA
jgi:hypothetical protein